MLSIPGFYEQVANLSADGCDAELAAIGVVVEQAADVREELGRLGSLADDLWWGLVGEEVWHGIA